MKQFCMSEQRMDINHSSLSIYKFLCVTECKECNPSTYFIFLTVFNSPEDINQTIVGIIGDQKI